jgi:hypothetical protein
MSTFVDEMFFRLALLLAATSLALAAITAIS